MPPREERGVGAWRWLGSLTGAARLRRRHAVQAQRRPPSSHPEAPLPDRELPAYEVGLRQRGDLTFWPDEAALAGWQAPRRTTPGGQPRYSDLAIELVLSLRLVFHLALRQAEAFNRSALRLLGLELTVPDHTTLSRRSRAFAGCQSRAARREGPVHLVLDSTDLQLFGHGE